MKLVPSEGHGPAPKFNEIAQPVAGVCGQPHTVEGMEEREPTSSGRQQPCGDEGSSSSSDRDGGSSAGEGVRAAAVSPFCTTCHTSVPHAPPRC